MADKRDALLLSSFSSSSGAGVDGDEEEADVGKESMSRDRTPIPVEQFDSATYRTMEAFISLTKAQEKTGVGSGTIRKAMNSKPEGRIIQGRAFGFRHPTSTTNVAEDSDEDESSDTGYVLNLSSATPSSTTPSTSTTTANHDDTTEQGHPTRTRKLPISVPASDMKVLDAETLRRMREELNPLHHGT